jgi:methylglyoxal synthase
MVDFAKRYSETLSKCQVVATGHTGQRISTEAGIAVETVLSGPMGGDQQIGSRIACERVDIVIFFRDPLSAQPHEPDVSALLRLCDVHNIPLATNLSSAEIMIEHIRNLQRYSE